MRRLMYDADYVGGPCSDDGPVGPADAAGRPGGSLGSSWNSSCSFFHNSTRPPVRPISLSVGLNTLQGGDDKTSGSSASSARFGLVLLASHHRHGHGQAAAGHKGAASALVCGGKRPAVSTSRPGTAKRPAAAPLTGRHVFPGKRPPSTLARCSTNSLSSQLANFEMEDVEEDTSLSCNLGRGERGQEAVDLTVLQPDLAWTLPCSTPDMQRNTSVTRGGLSSTPVTPVIITHPAAPPPTATIGAAPQPVASAGALIGTSPQEGLLPAPPTPLHMPRRRGPPARRPCQYDLLSCLLAKVQIRGAPGADV